MLEYGPDWTEELKEYIRARDDYTCQECDKSPLVKLHVHHIDYDKSNSDPNNLISLCHRCHAHTNARREYHTVRYQALRAGEPVDAWEQPLPLPEKGDVRNPPIVCIVDGVEYPSYAAVMRILGLTRYQLDFVLAVEPKEQRRLIAQETSVQYYCERVVAGVVYKDIHAAVNALGLPYSVVESIAEAPPEKQVSLLEKYD